jgi:nitroreductase
MLSRAKAFEQAMRSRRTVRDFSPAPVPREVIEAALRTAAGAPSGANQQPWTFVAIADPAIKARIRVAAEEEERAFYAGRAGEEWLDALSALGTDWRKPFL